MLRNSALIVFALSCLTEAVYYLDLDLCDGQPENMWEMEGNVEKNNIAFLHGCSLITRDTKLPFEVTSCIFGVEVHVAVSDWDRVLRIDLLREKAEWCSVTEDLEVTRNRLRLHQEFACKPYVPDPEYALRMYLSCDPRFTRPVAVVIFQPISKRGFTHYVEAFLYGWCLSLICTSTVFSNLFGVLLLLVTYKPESVVFLPQPSRRRSAGYHDDEISNSETRNKLLASILKAPPKEPTKEGRRATAEKSRIESRYTANSKTKAPRSPLNTKRKSKVKEKASPSREKEKRTVISRNRDASNEKVKPTQESKYSTFKQSRTPVVSNYL